MSIRYFFVLFVVKAGLTLDVYCPSGAVKSNNVCYTFSSTTATFIDAQINCTEQGGNLVNVDSQFINMLLISNATKQNWQDFWIGGTLIKVYNDAGVTKIWIWEGLDKLVKYDDWGFNEPSNKGGCAAVKTSDGTWFAEDCSAKKYFVCSIPMKIDVCDNEWTYFPLTRFCYKVFYHSNWNVAESNCFSLSSKAHLVSIHSKEEDLFVQDLSHCGVKWSSHDISKGTIIGLYTTTNDNSKWKWTDNSVIDYIPWGGAEPNLLGQEKCASIFSDPLSDVSASYWNNMPCDLEMRNYVCKKLPTQIKFT